MTERAQPVDLGILLALAYQEFVRELRETHERMGYDDLGRSDGVVFRALAGRPMTTSDLAVRLGVTKQGAAQIVEDMQRRGYLERRPDPTDGRARLLSLSAKGEAALAAARRFHRAYERRLVKVHGAEAVATLRSLLETMAGGADSTVDPHLKALYL
jgi:DNA-binding MarR family transcriptional regulator